MARPRTVVDEQEIRRAHQRGASITVLAQLHDVSRDIVRRVVNETAPPDRVVVEFPFSHAPVAPAGQVTSAELMDRTGITYRMLDFWTRCNYLRTTTPAEPGSGNARFYLEDELAVVHLVVRLRDAGLTPANAFPLARELVETGGALFAGIRLDLPEEF